ncbi:hypothetical protein [Methylopila sp. 73B]|uniref:lipopolysaccharide biosynthesis protein n=1 Tax=Methylopila sp. 73B TaxID=1120792 RepID=UPI000364E435|nr:hypothetical protein [Methylopila sp. 73B]
MKDSNLVLYFGSRVVSAAGNLVSVALFTRLVSPAEYGAYVLTFAWAIIVYGFATQWMKFAYFGVYRAAQAETIVASYARLLGAATLVVALGLGLAAAFGAMTPGFAAALFGLFFGMTVYEALVEVARTRLAARAVALSMIFRAVFSLVLGCVALTLEPTAISLSIAIAVAHLIAAVPSALAVKHFVGAPASRDAAATLVRYGWPLILSFGVMAVGQTVDRLMISYFAGDATLGPYGVIADLMRQSFMVVGESIALALITVGKQLADEGHEAESDAVMRRAFQACLAAATFGAAFFVVFGHDLARLALGEPFAQRGYEIIPYFAVAFCFMTLKNFYFSQVIFFAKAALLEFIIAAVFVATSAAIALALVPPQGAIGGAIALMIAHGVATLAAALLGRRLRKLPVDMTALAVMPAAALGVTLAAFAIDGWSLHPAAALAAKTALFVAVVGAIALRFDLFSLARGRAARGSPA